MKTSELTGAQLDYWVAKAMGLPLRADVWHGDGVFVGHGSGGLASFAPSTDWTQGGPIIEREQISIGYGDQGGRERGGWTAFVHEVDGLEFDFESPLVAAMRAFVASKFGENLPDDAG